MSEVEKMYENAGIVPDCEHGECGLDYCPNNYGCGYAFYPEFTAEKQLSLMAFLINRKVELSFKAEQVEITVEAISRGLAGIVNKIWQDLTEEERKQIKNILESEVRE